MRKCIKLFKNRNTIDCKLVLKIKYKSNTLIKRYKVRIIISKFLYLYRINYQKLFILKIKRKLFKILFVMLVLNGLNLT